MEHINGSRVDPYTVRYGKQNIYIRYARNRERKIERREGNGREGKQVKIVHTQKTIVRLKHLVYKQ